MADVLRIQNTHGTLSLDWLASGGHVTMKPHNFHQKIKRVNHMKISQWLKNTGLKKKNTDFDFRLIFSSLVASYSLVATASSCKLRWYFFRKE